MSKEPAEDGDEKEPKSFWPILWKLSATALFGLVTWLGGYISKEYEKIKDTNALMEKRIEELEQDKAKWATLAALEERQLEMRIQLEVMRQTWSYEYGRKIPTGFPDKAGEPTLKPPAELFRDVDRYRSMQQQKVEPTPKK